jgi:hypothetical protein
MLDGISWASLAAIYSDTLDAYSVEVLARVVDIGVGPCRACAVNDRVIRMGCVTAVLQAISNTLLHRLAGMLYFHVSSPLAFATRSSALRPVGPENVPTGWFGIASNIAVLVLRPAVVDRAASSGSALPNILRDLVPIRRRVHPSAAID